MIALRLHDLGKNRKINFRSGSFTLLIISQSEKPWCLKSQGENRRLWDLQRRKQDRRRPHEEA